MFSLHQLRVDVITRFAHFEILEELLGRYAAALGRSSVFYYEALQLDRFVLGLLG